MKKLAFSLLTLLIIFSVKGQSKKIKDKLSIKEMCGCFEVQFNFAETFITNNKENHEKSNNYQAKALEWAQLVLDENNEISIQHILISGNDNNPYIIKHWRQDWLYQNRNFYNYDGNNKWVFKRIPKKEVKGQWTQKVYQVDDSPRYEATGTWVHIDKKSFWESTTSAPLPRREYTKRNDYNVLMRGNRHEISENGWIHDQDNKKVKRISGEKDNILAHEKGLNYYIRVDEQRCKDAVDWWIKNENKWENVRNKWEEIYARNTNLSIKKSVDNLPLFMKLFSDEMIDSKQINETIELYINY